MRWTERDGSVHTAPQVAAADAAPVPVGTPCPLWVDQGLRPVPPPPSDQDAAVQGFVVVVVVDGFVVALVVLTSMVWLLRWALDRRRLRQWEDDWLEFRRGRDRGAAGVTTR